MGITMEKRVESAIFVQQTMQSARAFQPERAQRVVENLLGGTLSISRNKAGDVHRSTVKTCSREGGNRDRVTSA